MIFYTIVIYCLIFLFFSGKPFTNDNITKWTWPGVFSIHVCTGLFFLYIYTHVVGPGELSQDAGAYFFESEVLYNVFWQSPADYFQLLFGFGDINSLTQQHLLETNHWDVGSQALSNESRNMIRLHSLLHFLSFKLPEVHILFMALISTLSGFLFYRSIRNKTRVSNYISIIVVCFVPNFLFWSSGLLKEPIYLFGFSLIIYGLFTKEKLVKHWLAFTTGILLLLLFKFHFLLIVLLGITIWRISRLFDANKIILTATITLSGIFFLLLTFSSLRVELTKTISRKQFDFKNISRGGLHVDTDSCFYFFNEHQLDNLSIKNDSVFLIAKTEVLKVNHKHRGAPDTVTLFPDGVKMKIHFMRPKSESYFELTDLNFNFNQLVKLIPEGLINGFFRPFYYEKNGLLKWISIVEWLLIWAFFLISFRWIKNISSTQIELYIFLFVISLLSAMIIGWTTPVSNAIVRYRIPIHLCMVLVTLLNWNQKTLQND